MIDAECVRPRVLENNRITEIGWRPKVRLRNDTARNILISFLVNNAREVIRNEIAGSATTDYDGFGRETAIAYRNRRPPKCRVQADYAQFSQKSLSNKRPPGGGSVVRVFISAGAIINRFAIVIKRRAGRTTRCFIFALMT